MTLRKSLILMSLLPLSAVACSDSAGSPVIPDESLLSPPPAGAGVQLTTNDIAVPTGTEEQDCYFFKVRDLAQAGGLIPRMPVNLHRVQVAQRPARTT